MTATAEIVCYAQPVTAACEAMAWVNTAATVTLRRSITSKAEAAAAIADARKMAEAVGVKMCVKVTTNTWGGGRRPAGVKALEGGFIVG